MVSNRIDEAADVLDSADRIALQFEEAFVPLLRNRGIFHLKKKEFDRAEKLLNAAVEAVDPGNSVETAAVHFAIANLHIETGRYTEAMDHLGKALESDRLSGFHPGIAEDLSLMGSALLAQEKYAEAVSFFKRSIKIYALVENGKKVKEVGEKLKTASEKAGLDITLTNHFVKTWLEGKALENPCR